MAKLNATDGTGLWGWQGGSSGNDYANGVAVDSRGDVYACGAATGQLFDNGEEPSSEALRDEENLRGTSAIWGSMGGMAGAGEARREEGDSKLGADVTDIVVAKVRKGGYCFVL